VIISISFGGKSFCASEVHGGIIGGVARYLCCLRKGKWYHLERKVGDEEGAFTPFI
jgi:hypothetical protein